MECSVGVYNLIREIAEQEEYAIRMLMNFSLAPLGKGPSQRENICKYFRFFSIPFTKKMALTAQLA